MATIKASGVTLTEQQKSDMRLGIGLANAISLEVNGLQKAGQDLSNNEISAIRNNLEVLRTIKLTQAEYDLLTPDDNTLYVIVG